MAPPKPRQGLWLGMAMATLAATSLGIGWWLGHLHHAEVPSDQRRSDVTEEIQQLRRRLQMGDASPAQQQRLLELLVAMDRKEEATPLLERLADQEPKRWFLRLLLAELRRDQKDPRGAERELRQVLSQRPNQVEALQLMALLQLESGRGAEAQRQLEAALQRVSSPNLQPEALPIGLLLAQVLQQRGLTSQADAQLIQLSSRFPTDARPLLARALLQHEKGDNAAAQQTLAEARRRQTNTEAQQRLDQVAAAWGLEALKAPASVQNPATPTSPAGRGNP
jgi:tetratricopeptide (TPR) repeat protein